MGVLVVGAFANGSSAKESYAPMLPDVLKSHVLDVPGLRIEPVMAELDVMDEAEDVFFQFVNGSFVPGKQPSTYRLHFPEHEGMSGTLTYAPGDQSMRIEVLGPDDSQGRSWRYSRNGTGWTVEAREFVAHHNEAMP